MKYTIHVDSGVEIALRKIKNFLKLAWLDKSIQFLVLSNGTVQSASPSTVHDQEFLLEQDVEKNMQECINA